MSPATKPLGYSEAAEHLLGLMASCKVSVEGFDDTLRELCQGTPMKEGKLCKIACRQLDRGEHSEVLYNSIHPEVGLALRLRAVAFALVA